MGRKKKFRIMQILYLRHECFVIDIIKIYENLGYNKIKFGKMYIYLDELVEKKKVKVKFLNNKMVFSLTDKGAKIVLDHMDFEAKLREVLP